MLSVAIQTHGLVAIFLLLRRLPCVSNVNCCPGWYLFCHSDCHSSSFFTPFQRIFQEIKRLHPQHLKEKLSLPHIPHSFSQTFSNNTYYLLLVCPLHSGGAKRTPGFSMSLTLFARAEECPFHSHYDVTPTGNHRNEPSKW